MQPAMAHNKRVTHIETMWREFDAPRHLSRVRVRDKGVLGRIYALSFSRENKGIVRLLTCATQVQHVNIARQYQPAGYSGTGSVTNLNGCGRGTGHYIP